MKKVTTFAIAILAAIATLAQAEPVPLSISATGYTDLLKPQSISYVAGVDAVVDDPATADIDESADAVPAHFVISASYRLGYKTTVVDMTLDGIGVQIAPASAPEFVLTMTVPVAVWEAYYTGDTAALIGVLSVAGSVVPGPELTETIRSVAFGLLAAE
ncbi:MAG: hypothetical protein EOM20_03340 [Spartobacteria bacterium]|nr:hypothetical protein [Spartobacteria bacterium]